MMCFSQTWAQTWYLNFPCCRTIVSSSQHKSNLCGAWSNDGQIEKKGCSKRVIDDALTCTSEQESYGVRNSPMTVDQSYSNSPRGGITDSTPLQPFTNTLYLTPFLTVFTRIINPGCAFLVSRERII